MRQHQHDPEPPRRVTLALLLALVKHLERHGARVSDQWKIKLETHLPSRDKNTLTYTGTAKLVQPKIVQPKIVQPGVPELLPARTEIVTASAARALRDHNGEEGDPARRGGHRHTVEKLGHALQFPPPLGRRGAAPFARA